MRFLADMARRALACARAYGACARGWGWVAEGRASASSVSTMCLRMMVTSETALHALSSCA